MILTGMTARRWCVWARQVDLDPAWGPVRELHPNGAARRLVKAALTRMLRDAQAAPPEPTSLTTTESLNSDHAHTD